MKEPQKGLLVVFSGPSGVGKGTIRDKLDRDLLNMEVSVSLTTREKREGEVEGINYHYVSEETFQNAIDNDLFLENAPFVKNSYGTLWKPVKDWLDEGKTVMLEIETNGARQVMSKIPDCLTIFVLPPSMEELEQRIRGRKSEPDHVIEERLQKARKEMQLTDLYQHVVINDDADECAAQVQDIIQKERVRRGLV